MTSNVKTFPFSHHELTSVGDMVSFDGEVCIFCEVIMVTSYNYENLDVFNPMYTMPKDPTEKVIQHAHTTHSRPQVSSKHQVIRGKTFPVILDEWLNNLAEPILKHVKEIVNENYDFRAWLE
jgi:hypothetical protein